MKTAATLLRVWDRSPLMRGMVMAKKGRQRKVKISIFVTPEIARAMKMQAARMGCRGVSECFEKLFAMHQKALKDIIP